MIVVYADESGTHHPEGLVQGSQYPIIAGFAARESTWATFLISWAAVLKKYDVSFFHGRELEGARLAITQNRPASKQLLKNEYFTKQWDIKKIESFRRSLTKVAVAGNKIPIIGGIGIQTFNKIKSAVPEKDPYKYCMSEFFRVYYYETSLQWGNFKSDVQFVFDQNENKEWCAAIHEVFDAYQKKDPRMSGPSFQDKKKYPFWPLQAADLLAYRVRQLVELHYTGKNYVLEANDKVLLKNLLVSAGIINPQLKHFLKNKTRNNI
jgi:hypothetical protein